MDESSSEDSISSAEDVADADSSLLRGNGTAIGRGSHVTNCVSLTCCDTDPITCCRRFSSTESVEETVCSMGPGTRTRVARSRSLQYDEEKLMTGSGGSGVPGRGRRNTSVPPRPYISPGAVHSTSSSTHRRQAASKKSSATNRKVQFSDHRLSTTTSPRGKMYGRRGGSSKSRGAGSSSGSDSSKWNRGAATTTSSSSSNSAFDSGTKTGYMTSTLPYRSDHASRGASTRKEPPRAARFNVINDDVTVAKLKTPSSPYRHGSTKSVDSEETLTTTTEYRDKYSSGYRPSGTSTSREFQYSKKTSSYERITAGFDNYASTSSTLKSRLNQFESTSDVDSSSVNYVPKFSSYKPVSYMKDKSRLVNDYPNAEPDQMIDYTSYVNTTSRPQESTHSEYRSVRLTTPPRSRINTRDASYIPRTAATSSTNTTVTPAGSSHYSRHDFDYYKETPDIVKSRSLHSVEMMTDKTGSRDAHSSTTDFPARHSMSLDMTADGTKRRRRRRCCLSRCSSSKIAQQAPHWIASIALICAQSVSTAPTIPLAPRISKW